jgi:DNA-binding transcriptional regulator PaaX
MDTAATRTRIFGVLVLVGQPVSTRELVALCEPLGLSATNVKSHLTRLVSEGALFRTGPRRAHRYAISPQRQEIVAAISSRFEAGPSERWDGQWLIVALKPPTNRVERPRLRRALWFEGFRPCGLDTYLRPAWPNAWAVARAHALASVASACVIGALVGALNVGQVRKLYRLASMDAQARRLVRRIQEVADGVSDLEGAFKARLTVGGLVVGLVSHIPDLPPEIWDDLTGVRELQAAYSRFEARVAERANAYVDAIVSQRQRLNPPTSRSRQRSRPQEKRGPGTARTMTDDKRRRRFRPPHG